MGLYEREYMRIQRNNNIKLVVKPIRVYECPTCKENFRGLIDWEGDTAYCHDTGDKLKINK